MKILVTGDRGLVGRELVARLVGDGHQVVPFDLQPGGPVPPRDLRDAAALAHALEGCDGVYHLAAVSRVAWGEQDPATCHDINVAATRSLVDAMRAAGVPWLVFASSREVYGDTEDARVSETAAVAPVNAYGRSKADGEALLLGSGRDGPRVAIVRLSNVYGTMNDHPDRAIPSILWRAMNDDPITLTGATTFFDFVHVDDTVDGLMLAGDAIARAAGNMPIVHLATGVATTLETLARLSVALCGSTSSVAIMPPRAFDVTGFCGDPARAAEVYGWRPGIALREGLERLRADMIAAGRPISPAFRPSPSSGHDAS